MKIRKKIITHLIAGLAVFSMNPALSANQVAEAELSPPPNVILIMLDDVGYESFGAYGSTQYSTPQFDRLAEEGMLFDYAFSQPVCTPSRVKIMTGKSNVRNYVTFGLLAKREKTFAHYFKDAGYRTMVAGKWQLYAQSNFSGEQFVNKGQTPSGAGFDEFACWQITEKTPRYWNPKLEINEMGEFTSFGRNEFGPDVINAAALDFIERNANAGQPFFLYYPMILPHEPFVPTPDSADRSSKDHQKNFEDMVAYADKLAGKVADAVDALGIGENTLIIYTSDNGAEPAGGHNRRAILSRLGDRTISGGKRLPTEAGTRVPLVARWTGKIKPGSRTDELVDFADFLPTITEAAGIELTEEIDGRSFLWRLLDKPGEPKEAIYIFYQPCFRGNSGRPTIFARDHDWVLFSNGRLYNIKKDPEQKNPVTDLSEEAMAVKQKLQAVLDSYPSEGQNITNLEYVK